jgi:guanine deaminase
MVMALKRLLRADFLSLLPGSQGDPAPSLTLPDGGMVIDGDGVIEALGPFEHLQNSYPEATLWDCRPCLAVPGMIDCHVHYPQVTRMAAPAPDLLSWLQTHIFPAEAELAEASIAASRAALFVGTLLSSGTTTAAVYGSQFLEANLSLIAEAARQGLELVLGPTLMDRHGLEPLYLTPLAAQEHVWALREAMDEHWVTPSLVPRFAIACSSALLDWCGVMAEAHPDWLVQTHLNENQEEIDWTSALFPKSIHYSQVYDHYGLLGPRTLLAHSIHTRDDELLLLQERQCTVVTCPSSNAFLGSGPIDLARHRDAGVPLSLGTDLGAGLHPALWREAGSLYLTGQVRQQRLSAQELLYLATLAGAKALGRAELGHFSQGARADLVLLSPGEEPLLLERWQATENLWERWFTFCFLGCTHGVRATVKRGQVVFSRNKEEPWN